MVLTPKYKQILKGKAHPLKPVVMVGHLGLTPAVNKEIDRALNDHELIKVRIQTNDRDLRKALLAEMCELNRAELVQLIGNIGVLYRPKADQS